MMKVVSVKEFKDQATRLLREEVERGNPIVLTRRRKPIALIKPFSAEGKEAVVSYLIGEIGNLFRQAGLSRKEILKALEAARKEIYGVQDRH